MLKLKLQNFGHLMWIANSLEKTLMLEKVEGRRGGWQRMILLDGITDSMCMSLSKLWDIVKDRETWHAAAHGITKSQTWLNDWTITVMLNCLPWKWTEIIPSFLRLHPRTAFQTLLLTMKATPFLLRDSVHSNRYNVIWINWSLLLWFWSDGKESTCNAGDLGSIPGLGRSPGEGNGYPLQYSCLERLVGFSPWYGKALDTTEQLLHTSWSPPNKVIETRNMAIFWTIAQGFCNSEPSCISRTCGRKVNQGAWRKAQESNAPATTEREQRQQLGMGSYVKVCGRDRQSLQISIPTAKKQTGTLSRNCIESLQIEGHWAQRREAVLGQTWEIGCRTAPRTRRSLAHWPGEIMPLMVP